MTTRQPAPRFTAGQRVRIIANAGGLYGAQIGVVGVIERKRQYRRWGYHTYDVTYQDAKGIDKSITAVREDDLEAVEIVELSDSTPSRPPSRFTLGQRVKIVSDHAGLYSSRVGRIGRIDGVGDQLGARWHLVSYAEKGALRIVNVREDDLEPVEAVAEVAAGTPSATPAPPFGFGQVVRVVNVRDPLNGLVGRIVRRRPPRRGSRKDQLSYDFAYTGADGHEVVAHGVYADDLEAVFAWESAPFRLGQRVTVHPPADGLEDEYPSFTHYPIVGEIVSHCQVTAGGLHCYDVRFPRIVGGVSSEWWPPVSIREAHLVPEPIGPGWMAQAEIRTKREERPLTPLPEPKFSIGELVTVHPQSVLAYETFTRKGAVGTISGIGKPVRGIRRYTVRYPTGVMTRIREEHLVRVETPPTMPDSAAPPSPPPPATNEPVFTIACARGGRVDCDHEWQTGWDSRYRLCRRCKRAEQVAEQTAEPVESEARA